MTVAASRLAPRGQACAAQNIALAYGRYGLALGPHLEGEHAFILYDTRRKVLLATSTVTSRLPLAYWSRGTTVAVASRVLPLARHPGAPRGIDDIYLAHLLLGSMAAPCGATAIRGILRLAVGEALLVGDGRITTRKIDTLSPRVPIRGERETDATWSALGDVVERTIRFSESPCVSLSGGLDSAAIMAAAVERKQRISAFSIVAPATAELDESRAIDALHSWWPALPLSRVDCSNENVYPDLATGELRDDPPLAPLMLFPARLRLWGAIRAAGFRTVIDGEGGDQLFSLLLTPLDALRRGDWLSLSRHLRKQSGRRAIVERSLVLPLLPQRVKDRWARSQAGTRAQLPVYIGPESSHASHMAQASEAWFEATIARPATEAIERWLSRPIPAGAYASHDHIAASLGLRVASPLLDRTFVELVLGLPPSTTLPLGNDRRFQRALLAGRIPETVRTAPKDVRFGEHVLPLVVGSARARQVLRADEVRRRLEGWVRLQKLDAILDAIPRGYTPSELLAWQLECVVTFAEWYARASKEYGIV
jgi:asparagine synthase (glutamine-hydrolysing)